MPNVDAKFRADFSEFDKGVKEATGKLLEFEKSGNKAGKTAEDFGYKLIKASESAAYLKKTGLDDQLRQVDGILGQLGVSTGGFTKVLSDLGSMSGKTAASLGVLGTAAAALATGLAAYKGVRFFADFMGTAEANDKQVQGWAEHLLGFASGQAEAAAKADVLARATENAKRPITDYGEAIEINRKAAEQQSLTFQRMVNPANEIRTIMAGWQKEIREANKRGDLMSLNEQLDKQTFSIEKLSKMYGISAGAIEDYQRRRDATFKAQEQQDQASAAANARRVAEAEKAAKAEAEFAEAKWKQQLKLDEDLRASNEKMTQARLAQVNAGVMAELAAYQQLNPVIAEQETIYSKLAAGQQQLAIAKAQGLPTLQQETLLHQQFGQALMDEAIKEEQLRWKIEETTQARKVDNQAYIDAAQARKNEGLSFTPLTDMSGGDWTSREKRMNEFYGSSMDPISAAYRAAGIFTGGTGGGIRPGYTINVNGNVIGTQEELARLVGNALTGSYRSGGNRLPA